MTLVQLFSLSVLSLVALVMSQDIPTSYLLPEPTATSFLLNPTGNLGTSCSQEVLDCMSKLHADCKVDKPKDYMVGRLTISGMNMTSGDSRARVRVAKVHLEILEREQDLCVRVQAARTSV